MTTEMSIGMGGQLLGQLVLMSFATYGRRDKLVRFGGGVVTPHFT